MQPVLQSIQRDLKYKEYRYSACRSTFDTACIYMQDSATRNEQKTPPRRGTIQQGWTWGMGIQMVAMPLDSLDYSLVQNHAKVSSVLPSKTLIYVHQQRS